MGKKTLKHFPHGTFWSKNLYPKTIEADFPTGIFLQNRPAATIGSLNLNHLPPKAHSPAHRRIPHSNLPVAIRAPCQAATAVGVFFFGAGVYWMIRWGIYLGV